MSSSRQEGKGERIKESIWRQGMHLSVSLSVYKSYQNMVQKDRKLSLNKQTNTKTDYWAFFSKLGQRQNFQVKGAVKGEWFQGRFYENIKVKSEEAVRMLLKQHHSGDPWEWFLILWDTLANCQGFDRTQRAIWTVFCLLYFTLSGI